MAIKIRDGKVTWETKNNRLYVEGVNVCEVPNGWSNEDNIYNRENVYNEAINSFE